MAAPRICAGPRPPGPVSVDTPSRGRKTLRTKIFCSAEVTEAAADLVRAVHEARGLFVHQGFRQPVRGARGAHRREDLAVVAADRGGDRIEADLVLLDGHRVAAF